MGRLEAIWTKRAHGGPMDPTPRAELRAAHGIVGNADIGGRRQVTIIEQEVWQRHMHALGASLDPARRRANFMVSGCDLRDTRMRVLRVGTCRLRILGETKPCEQMEAAWTGLQATMRPDWGGGAFAEVIDDGVVAVGDVVSWEPEA
ncbi:MAG: MOSC domain-containing protein [Gemmatimonadaceae bacterium]